MLSVQCSYISQCLRRDVAHQIVKIKQLAVLNPIQPGGGRGLHDPPCEKHAQLFK